MQRDTLQGLIAGASAYVIWGLVVIYWKLMPGVSPWEVLAHRVVWSVVLLAPIIVALGRVPAILAAVRSSRSLLALLASSMLIASNWGIFIWAVADGRIIETSLGYYINPLFAIGLGVLLLGEKLSAWRTAAFGLAAIGVAIQAVALGGVPFVSLSLAASFAVYGYVRKVVKVEALDGLFVETLIVTPLALGVLAFMASNATLSFGHTGWLEAALLIGAGPITALPLFLFSFGARRVQLSTMGFLQYIAPTISLILAVAVYHEPFGTTRAVSFGFIWAALILASLEGFRRTPARPEPATP